MNNDLLAKLKSDGTIEFTSRTRLYQGSSSYYKLTISSTSTIASGTDMYIQFRREDGEETSILPMTRTTGTNSFYFDLNSDWYFHTAGNLYFNIQLRTTISEDEVQVLSQANSSLYINAVSGYSAPAPLLPQAIDIIQASIEDLDTTKADITYVDSQDDGLQSQIDSNDSDINDLNDRVDNEIAVKYITLAELETFVPTNVVAGHYIYKYSYDGDEDGAYVDYFLPVEVIVRRDANDTLNYSQIIYGVQKSEEDADFFIPQVSGSILDTSAYIYRGSYNIVGGSIGWYAWANASSINDKLALKEDLANKVDTITSSDSDNYTSEKAVYDELLNTPETETTGTYEDATTVDNALLLGGKEESELDVASAVDVTTTINGNAITSIFESNGTTVKEATHSTSADSSTSSTNVNGYDENDFKPVNEVIYTGDYVTKQFDSYDLYNNVCDADKAITSYWTNYRRISYLNFDSGNLVLDYPYASTDEEKIFKIDYNFGIFDEDATPEYHILRQGYFYIKVWFEDTDFRYTTISNAQYLPFSEGTYEDVSYVGYQSITELFLTMSRTYNIGDGDYDLTINNIRFNVRIDFSSSPSATTTKNAFKITKVTEIKEVI